MRFTFVVLLSVILLANLVNAQDPGNKEIVRRYIDDMWNHNKPEIIPSLVSSDYRHTSSSGAEWRGSDRVKELVSSLHEALSNLHYTIDAMNSEGDLVATRTTVTGIFVKPLLGIAPTNAKVSYQEWLWQRIRNGKIVEGWTLTNAEAMLRRSATGPAK
jgi:predicted ester cyclase